MKFLTCCRAGPLLSSDPVFMAAMSCCIVCALSGLPLAADLCATACNARSCCCEYCDLALLLEAALTGTGSGMMAGVTIWSVGAVDAPTVGEGGTVPDKSVMIMREVDTGPQR